MSPVSTDRTPTPLTPRQLEVLELIAKGLTNGEIANVLGIAQPTVKNHVSAVIEALDVTNRTEAATRLHELGLSTAEVSDSFKVDGFGARPAIAVLPFDNFSDDPKYEFLADGIVEDLVTSLANWRWFPVISRNSTFVYKGKSVDVKEVSHALGAGFVIEGSVRPAGDRLRLTVQVLDGATAEHVWAERYDLDIADIFDITDEIVATIVATLEPALLRIGGLRVLSRRPDQLDAWENLQRAWVHVAQNSLPSYLEAQACLDRATQIDPEMIIAWALSTYCQTNLHMVCHRDDAAEPASRLAHAAGKLAELDTTDPFTPLGSGMSLLVAGDREAALVAMRRAVELSPSMAFANWGMAAAEGVNGNAEAALGWMGRVFRLCPGDPILATAHLCRSGYLWTLGRLDEAEADLEQARVMAPELPHAYGQLAIMNAVRGENEKAASLVAQLKAFAPGYSPLVSMRVLTPPELHEGLTALFASVGLGDEPVR